MADLVWGTQKQQEANKTFHRSISRHKSEPGRDVNGGIDYNIEEVYSHERPTDKARCGT